MSIIQSNNPNQQKGRFSAAGHRRSGISRDKERNFLYESIFPKRQKAGCANPRKHTWGYDIKVK
jgi:hypothetical protein